MSRPHQSSGRSILDSNQKIEHASVSALPLMRENSSAPKSIIKLHKTAKKKHSYLEAFSCECGPDFYNRVLGPTADEAILRGVQTIINVCHKLMVCDDDEEEVEVARQKSVNMMTPAKSDKTAPQIVSEILESIGFPSETAAEIVNTSLATLEEQKPSLASKILQTSTPEMVSKILQTIGLSPELVSQILQTSFEDLVQESPSMASKWLQTSAPELKSGMMQTTPPPSSVSVFMQTGEADAASGLTGLNVASRQTALNAASGLTGLTVASAQKGLSVSSQKVTDLPPEIVREEVKNQKGCICCKCYPNSIEKDEETDIKSKDTLLRSLSVSERVLETERMMCGESPPKLKMCKCCECSAPVPVLCRQKKIRHECICYPKPKEKCKCSSGSKRSKTSKYIHLPLAKGDMCSSMDPNTYYCDSYELYQY